MVPRSIVAWSKLPSAGIERPEVKYRFAPFIIALITISACNHPEKQSPQMNSASGVPLAATISVADPATVSQLTKGFYDLEEKTWRWTQKNFSVTLAAPRGAAEKGAVLVLRFTLPEVLIKNLKSIDLTTVINGFMLTPKTFNQAGDLIYRQELPRDVLRSNSVVVDFSLDKTIPPSAADNRELGIIVSEVGLELP